MKRLLVICVALGLVTNVFAMDPETKQAIVVVYNYNVNLYANIVGLFGDLNDTLIDADRAEGKIQEWMERYREQTAEAPSETRKMCELMTEVLKKAGDAAEDYAPLHRRTKDALTELEEAKTELKREMKDIQYMME